jgi:hypothetical protein
MFHPPFKVMLIGFSAFKFACGCFVTALPKLVRQDESPTDEEDAQDAVGFDFELEYLIRFSHMFERAFVPNVPRIPHPREERGKCLLTPSGELFKPRFRRRNSVRSHVELDAQDRTVIDQPAG